MNWKGYVILSILLVLTVFTLQNHESVKITFLLWSFTTSRAIIVFLSLFMGLIIGLILSFIYKDKKL